MYNKEKQQFLVKKTEELLQMNSDHLERPLPRDKADVLREVLIFHEYRYYQLNDPLISDFEFDTLYKALVALEEEYPELVTTDSPTQRVSSDLVNDFPTVAHWSPMLSLANSYDREDLIDFDAQVKRLLQIEENVPVEYAVEPKFDGGTIVLVYENDYLIRAATRGNGKEGEEITLNARVIKSIPLKAAFSEVGAYRVEVRGEVLIAKSDFARINKERQEEGLSLFANPRNTATGGLRMKDPKEVDKRSLVAFMYSIGYAENREGVEIPLVKTHSDSLALLTRLGFKVPQEEALVGPNIEAVIDFCKKWEKGREAYPFEIDGMVVKVNDKNLQDRAGFTAHHPRWAIAFKFKAKQATTRLLSVTYQVGKIGSITPVAKVEPVNLAGATISSISLHNEDFIVEKDLRIGDLILIERAGDVIPHVVKAMEDSRAGTEQKIKFPKYCPVNDSEQLVELIREEGEAAWRCPDCVCGAQDLQKIIFHVSKTAMDIDGMGKSIVERFYELGWIRNIADVYRLNYEAIASLEGFGEKSASNLKMAIEKAKSNPIHRLLHSLSIHHLGQKAAILIAAEIDHVMDLKNWNEEKFTAIKDVGPIVAQNVMSFFQKEENLKIIEEMEALGVNMLQTKDDRPRQTILSGPFLGKTILFTGSLSKMSRKEAQIKAEVAGAKNISAVSKNLDYLVAGEKAGSKLKKAIELGSVTILSEDEFITMVQTD
jgi:DNA ligase (NAD+)